jgi:hypothetical protein
MQSIEEDPFIFSERQSLKLGIDKYAGAGMPIA